MYPSRCMILVYAFLLFNLAKRVIAQSEIATLYAPEIVPCPVGIPMVRQVNQSDIVLNINENNYLNTRRQKYLPSAFATYLESVQSSAKAAGISLPLYVSDILANSYDNLPGVGIALSGGGYRELLFGSAAVNAFDARNNTKSGGLLQATSIMTGLSGGGLFLSALYQANLPNVHDFLFNPSSNESNCDSTYSGWGGLNYQYDYFEPYNDTQQNDEYIEIIMEEVAGKSEKGFPLTFNDIWARFLARHYLNGTNPCNLSNDTVSYHGANIRYSALQELSIFQEYTAPYLILATASTFSTDNASQILSGNVAPLTNPIYEMTIYEFGSYEESLSAFIDMENLGSTPYNNRCIRGYDQLSFLEGATSNLFSQANTSTEALLASEVGPLFQLLNATYPSKGIRLDVGIIPNSFEGVKNFEGEDQAYLDVIDGGLTGLTLNLDSMTVEARNISCIVAIDATNDKNDFTAGSSLANAQQRLALIPEIRNPLPQLPTSTSLFLELNMTTYPSFFGCYEESPVPLLVYIANGPNQPPVTNISTEQTTFTPALFTEIFEQATEIVTRGRPANAADVVDAAWPVCLACAVADRQRAELAIPRSGICVDCMNRYCVYENYLASLSNSTNSVNSAMKL